ncbi:MAG: DUF1365 domain-containing protein [Candidatus Marinimicrobia bacterium]|nr:DUF1365 domain-containing protein [Candidatus Neomarinimicrobiota bacterium]|tara:strand:+ start:3380 stop:4141 length:762 start_codon:yes stop_codon:yes gene_type:complete
MISTENYIYEGYIRHRRFTPFEHFFKYPIFMMYFDISNIKRLSEGKSIFFRINKPSIISFYRKDYHGNKLECLDKAVRKTLQNKYQYIAKGPIRLLTHLRYFGYCFNPVSFYYCFDKEDKRVESVMAEVTNTPWNERYTYFISDFDSNNNLKSVMNKKFHVSPFWDMNHIYDWVFTIPNRKIAVNMKNYKENIKVFDASLNLERKTLNLKNLLFQIIKFPFITIKIFLRIHWQAIILWIKGATFHTHPKKIKV